MLDPGRCSCQWEQGYLCEDVTDHAGSPPGSPEPPRGRRGGESVPQVHCQPAPRSPVFRGCGEIQRQCQLQWPQPRCLTGGTACVCVSVSVSVRVYVCVCV